MQYTPSDAQALETRLQDMGLTAKRVTPDMINERIMSVEYRFVEESQLMLCVITLDNGYRETGVNMIVSPENFDEELSKELAYKQAYQKFFALFAFLLTEDRYQARPDLTVGSYEWAVALMKQGHKVTRSAWGSDVHVTYSAGNENLRAENIWNVHNRKAAEQNGGYAAVEAYASKYTHGRIAMGWLASQEDFNANDWVLLVEAE